MKTETRIQQFGVPVFHASVSQTNNLTQVNNLNVQKDNVRVTIKNLTICVICHAIRFTENEIYDYEMNSFKYCHKGRMSLVLKRNYILF